MTATMTSHAQAATPEHWLDRATLLGLLGFVSALQFSIAAAEVVLALTVVAWARLADRPPRAARSARRGSCRSPSTPAITLLSTAFSLDPRESLGRGQADCVLYLVVPLRLQRGDAASARTR